MVRHKQNWHDGTHSDGGVSKMCLHFGRGPWQEKSHNENIENAKDETNVNSSAMKMTSQ